MIRTCLAIITFIVLLATASSSMTPALANESARLPDLVLLNDGWSLQDTAKVKATGAELSQAKYQAKNWYHAVVPGTILTSLVKAGVYPEPLYGENNRPDRIPESLCRTSYWYRTEFNLPTSYAGKQVQLNFAGINYIAEVWLNGKHLGSISGAFTRGKFDVTSTVRSNSRNTLAVNILPPPDPGVPHEQTIANGVGPNGGILTSNGPTFLCSMGWDWIPGIRDRDMGIWQSVSLSAHGPVTVNDTAVSSDLPLPRLDTADLTVRTTVTNTSGSSQTGTLVGSFGSSTFSMPLTLSANQTRELELTAQTLPQLHVTHPKLWWPNGYGPQNLYKLNLQFVQNGNVSDEQNTQFGIRKITYVLPGSDNLALSVNGVPVLCKGGNWGMDEAMKRNPVKRLEAQIRMHRDANYTIIRNWVGQSTSEEFYNLCDKYGIMLWDEMFQPNPCDGPNPKNVEQYLANVREKITRYRSHPSIALWCGRNEGYPPPEIDNAIRKTAAALDPARLYQPSSTDGRGVHSGGPYHWRTPREYYVFNEPFKTEIGSVSIPTLESVQAMMPQKDWNVINDDWAEHDLGRGAQGGDWYPVTLANRYGAISNLADFVRKGQMANYESYRAIYEGRNSQLFQPCTGVITWMSNPSQPSFVWQLYAYDLEPNSSLFATRKACEPIHIQLNQNNWHMMVINNTPQQLDKLKATISIYNLDGSLKSTQCQSLTAAASAATDGGETVFPAGLSPVHFVKLQLFDAKDKLLSDNFYWRETNQDNFQALNSLAKTSLSARVDRQDLSDRVLLTVTLLNPTKVPALMAHLQLRKANSAERVLPVFYSDNYVSLLPGESKTISVEVAKSDLGDAAPFFVLDGWNVTTESTAAVAANPNVVIAEAHPAPVTDLVRINCGDHSTSEFFTFAKPTIPPKEFASDACFYEGSPDSHEVEINTSPANAAPKKVYQTDRSGESTYTIPVVKGKTYTLRLHFAETKFDKAGDRLFNLDINGERKLTNFDIFAVASGKNTAVVKDYPGLQPDADGNIVIHLTPGLSDQPSICGIEVLPTS